MTSDPKRVTIDGHREYTLAEARDLALQAIRDLDGRNGDPSKRANWIRERRLAWIVSCLLHRIDDATKSIQVREP